MYSFFLFLYRFSFAVVAAVDIVALNKLDSGWRYGRNLAVETRQTKANLLSVLLSRLSLLEERLECRVSFDIRQPDVNERTVSFGLFFCLVVGP